MNFKKQIAYHLNVELLGPPFLRWQRWRDESKIARLIREDRGELAPPLLVSARMKELMAHHYLKARYADGVKKVAWVTSGAPIEVLKALDFVLIYPENHAALCGARRQTESLAQEAENAGYSKELCSYARTDIGSLLSGKTPVGRLPKPDLLLCCNNICQTVLYWYQVLAEYFDVPLIVIDTPFLYDEAESHQIEYVRQQLEEMIPIAEKVAGKSLNYKRLKEVTKYSKEATTLWLTILERARHRPSPITAFDGFINMAPIVDLRGEAVTVQFYEQLLSEVDRRIEAGIGAIRHEKKRVLWDNLPLWFKLGSLSRMLASQGVNIVASTYTYAWGELTPMMDVEKPLETAATVYLHPILNRSTGAKLKSMKQMIRDFSIDGVILHSDRSCKPYSLGQIDQRDRIVKELALPALLLEADHADPRSFSEEQATTRLEAFIELMEHHEL